MTLPSRASRRAAAALAAAVSLLAILAPSAGAVPLLPPAHRVFTGLTGIPPSDFQSAVHKHSAVLGVFVTWGEDFEYAFQRARNDHARLMLHISTSKGYGDPAVITPEQIAQGRGDRYLLSLSKRIAKAGDPVYVRLMPEMNQANNAYCAFNADGSSRGASSSPSNFKQAWRRAVLILRGGPVAKIDAHLRALRMPPVRWRHASQTLPRLPVAFMWVPQTAGTPDIPANSAASYYPGGAYVDWVGTDFYSRFPNFTGLQRFYSEFKGKPFVFGEWALWGADDPGFVRALFSFIGSHDRVRMELYNQGESRDGPFRLWRYPRSRSEIRRLLRSHRFLGHAPKWRPKAHAAR